MERNIKKQLSEISRLMNYDRSKTIIEQEVEVGKPMVIQNDSTIKLPKNWYNYSGEQFDYPNYCKYPDKALPGTPEKPVLRDYCIYKGPGNTKVYFRKDVAIDTIQGREEIIKMYGKLEDKGLLKNLDDTQKDKLFYDMEKSFVEGSVKAFIIGDNTYYSTISKTFGPQGPWSHKGWYSNGRGYTQPKFEYVTDGWSEYYAGLKDQVSKIDDVINELASFLCGDDSPFAGGTVPILGYGTEELACDVMAGILMAVGGPYGVGAALAIEAMHAKDLYEKGDKTGAFISLTIGMLPLVGDAGAVILRRLIAKGGQKALTGVVKVLNMIVKFNTGEIGASKLWKSITQLSKDERALLQMLWSTSKETVSRAKRLSPEVGKLKSAIDELPESIKITEEGIETLSKMLEETKVLEKVGDIAAQFTSIFTLIFSTQFLATISGLDETEGLDEESLNKINQILNNTEELNRIAGEGVEIFR